MRPLIQYDLDEHPPGPSASAGLHPNARWPPTKKRKRNHRDFIAQDKASAAQKAKAPVPIQHWDDPGSAAVGVVYDEEGASVAVSYGEGEEEYYGEEEDAEEEGEGVVDWEEEEEIRPLTHGEIWDDSALIDAWNSAEAEYKVYHGMSKDWKTESVKRSPLWYNKPYTAPKPGSSKPSAHTHDEPEPDTAPLDFDTYVPTHDPSLGSATAAAPPAPFFVPPPSTTTISRDEAFNNALSAMYWSGYWTAVYHSQSQSQTGGLAEATADEIGADQGGDGDKDEEIQDLVPTQR